ncbi:SMP-30/gluconolactonase/LRE family protein [Mucilaginibacter sp. SJ]|uniref:SMP-30/gluconolactonase/LRE family protein n=1 Tax=Mucilaginibacter sp. SJ TaxID=3029053 RepID=UPI0023A93B20|nr:SMP-30/gluconolactonase/LRE family protein [Mucilaginibacter sp. SJ]WEA01416.1 SMP-30/gluconolactonase/LRE family protein [Mucilaginibacter sp. SJ]
MKKVSALILLISAFSVKVFAQTDANLYDPNTKPQLVAKQFSFTEGPAVDKKGNVFFTDQPNNKIWKYDTDGKLSVFLDSAGRSNGMYFDKKGNLISCADANDQLWSISPKGKVTVLLKDYQGHKFNGPNDVWVRPDGGIYITDPYYQRDYWTRKQPDLDGQKLYFLAKGKASAVMVDDKFVRPNGIIGTPDGKTLYVADIGDNKTYRYDINKDGTLSNRTLFIAMGCDGMTIDEHGNIYMCGKGVTIVNPKGEKIGHIDIDEPWTANICFGGKNKDVLFITASKAVYTFKMNVKGVD